MDWQLKKLRLRKLFIINFVSIFLFWLGAFTTNETVSAAEGPTVEITKENFTDYFTLNGSSTFDKETGTVTLTPELKNQVGSFYLNNKISLNTSFWLSGYINLGKNPSGGDGIGLAFHSGNTSDLGNAGGNLGIAGLQNAFGFKIDTYQNKQFFVPNDLNGSQIDVHDSLGFGQSPDTGSVPYGAFVITTDKQMPSKNGVMVQRWWADDIAESDRSLSKDDIDGKFHKFVVDYNAQTKFLTIEFTKTDGSILTWSRTVDKSYSTMSFTVTGSTGNAYNLQQFRLDSFKYQVAATIDVKYVDTSGNILYQGKVNYPQGEYVNGTYETKQETIKGYTYQRLDDKSLPANGTLTKSGNNGTVIYVYKANKYKVNFDANKGENVMPQQFFAYDEEKALSQNLFTRKNYSFTRWNTKFDGSGTFYNNKQVVKNLTAVPDDTVELFAQWVRNKGKVITKYVDENDPNKEISPSISQDGFSGDSYTTEAKIIDNYVLSKVLGSAQGVFPDNNATTVVEYVYKKKESPAAATVDVEYVDTSGNILYQGKVNYPQGEYVNGTYETKQETIKGYTYQRLDDKSLPAKGTLTKSGKNGTVIYVYEANKYNVRFYANKGENENVMPQQSFVYDKEQALSKNLFTRKNYKFTGWNTKSDGSGTSYTDEQVVKNLTAVPDDTVKLFAQWEYKKVTSPDTPKTPETPEPPKTPETPEPPKTPETPGTTVPVETGRVITQYVDENGNAIAKQDTQSGRVGDNYTTQAIAKAGYVLDKTKLPSNAKGKFAQTTIIVKYVYRKAKTGQEKKQVKKTKAEAEQTKGKKDKLPKTGARASVLMVMLGLSLLIAASYISSKKRVRK